MTTQEMIEWLHGMIIGPNGEPCERCRAIAARLKALDGMRKKVEKAALSASFQSNPRLISESLSAILDTVRENEDG